jgi:hypothetical protein
LIERLEAAVRPGLQDAAFHRGEDEGRQRLEIGAARQAIARRFQAAADGAGPRREIARDQLVRGQILGLDFQRQPSQRTAVAAFGGEQPFAIAFEDSEDALDGVAMPGEGRLHHHRVETLQVAFQHCQQQSLLTGEEVVKAAAIGLRALQQLRHAGGGVALLPEEVARGVQQAGAGGVRFGFGLNGHSRS